MPAIARLKRRREFLAVAGAGRKWATPGLVLQVKPHEKAEPEAAVPDGTGADDKLHDEKRQDDKTGEQFRVGYTASRKVGISVLRNRARRRLRSVVGEVMPRHAALGHDYVLIARAGTLERPYPALIEDLKAALRRLGVFRADAA